MFYKLIEKKCDEWLQSPSCSVKELIGYIERHGMMRDAQLAAIKVFLYLKLECANKPLLSMFRDGGFNYTDLSARLPKKAYDIVAGNPAAAALYEYSLMADSDGNPHLPQLEKEIRDNTDAIDYERIAKDIFSNVDYTDYLFSLPMGAGKTNLMAAFIYLDLYFAMNEPDNPVFAHNFIIMAPSGLKSSILPGLKNIMRFDPTWVLPENAARQVKSLIHFEVLDECSSKKGSNMVKNPNAQKINNHQPLEDSFGLVALTNAEKVILDRVGKIADDDLFRARREEYDMIEQANELRTIIGKIPHLGVYVDEVHHVADEGIKLRQVVTQWSKSGAFAYMLGFSGTPYLDKPEGIKITDKLVIRNQDLTNVVSHYPLADGIGNFLKRPAIRFENAEPDRVLANGVREFFEKYKDTVYEDGTCAKLAVFCADIDQLEAVVYPQVASLVAEQGLAPQNVILKNHQSNKTYKLPAEAKTQFASLDTGLSQIRVVLLVNIGKEGWDCRSLTGVILPGKRSSQIKVLQTTCRCLRQVTKNEDETALIWLNEDNAKTLNAELKKYQRTNIDELNRKVYLDTKTITRHSRRHIMNVPDIEYTQLHVTYTTVIEEDAHTAERLADSSIIIKKGERNIGEMNISGKRHIHKVEDLREHTEEAEFNQWLYTIQKESFMTLTRKDMSPYEGRLRQIFDTITVCQADRLLYNEDYNQETIRANIRKAFHKRCTTKSHTEELKVKAGLFGIDIAELERPRTFRLNEIFHPNGRDVDEILKADDSDAKIMAVIKEHPEPADALRPNIGISQKDRNRSYHYLPYHFDSTLEKKYFAERLLALAEEFKLEAYFNGDDTVTGFKLECYKQVKGVWTRIRGYVPDFLLLERDAEGRASKVLIIETKGAIYADKFRDRRHYMENEFLRMNEGKFDFLYLEDSEGKNNVEPLEKQTFKKIKEFFQR